MCLNVVHQVIACKSLNVLSRAKDGSAQGAMLKCSCMQVVEDNLLCNPFHLNMCTTWSEAMVLHRCRPSSLPYKVTVGSKV